MSESEKVGFGWSLSEALLAAFGWAFVAWKSEPDLRATDSVVATEFALAAA